MVDLPLLSLVNELRAPKTVSIQLDIGTSNWSLTLPFTLCPSPDSVRAQLIGDEENYVSYTDVVRIEAAADGAASVALSTVTISGAPTSTDGSGSVGFTGTYTAPTSPGASASSSASSSQATSTSGGSALTAASSSASSATASSASSAAASTTASTSDGSSLRAASSYIAGIVAFVALGMAVVI